MTVLKVYVCPECGDQETYHGETPGHRPTTYCLLHEDEPGRKDRPAHIEVEVVRVDELLSDREALERLRAEVFKHKATTLPVSVARAAIRAALGLSEDE